MNHIVDFSGGKDSTAMLLMMIEKKMRIDKIIFVDTTKEFPSMYDHIKKLEKMISPYEIERRTFDFDYFLKEKVITRGKYVGELGYGWPTMLSRWCTRKKVDELNRGLKSKETIHYVGIAADEVKRTERKSSRTELRYLLIEWGITEKLALEYCYSKGLDWGGLYDDFRRVSCYCCSLQPLKELRVLYFKYPKLWAKIQELDKNNRKSFRGDYTLTQLEEKFKKEVIHENRNT